MATITRYFRTDSTTGGDGTEDRTDGATRAYETMAAALVGEQTALAASGNTLHFICTQPGADTALASTAGYTDSATEYITIECSCYHSTRRIFCDEDFSLSSSICNSICISYSNISGVS